MALTPGRKLGPYEIQRLQGPYDVTADGKKFLINTSNQKEEGEPVTLVINWPAELKK